jgi:hypothetical protein
MTLSDAHDALSDLARQFHNDMNRQGTKELAAEEWLEKFRSWLPSGRTFAEEYERTLKFLKEFEERAGQ